jgi:uncharacterized repeat protein (TIGR01451 family)
MAFVLLVPMVVTAQTPNERAPEAAQADVTAKRAPVPAEPTKEEVASQPAPQVQVEEPAAKRTYQDVSAKLDSYLQNKLQGLGLIQPVPQGTPAAAVAGEPILVNIVAAFQEKAGQESLVDKIRPYFVDGKLYVEPAHPKEDLGLRLMAGVILPSNLVKVASFDAVKMIYSTEIQRAEPDVYPADAAPESVVFGPDDWAKLRDKAAETRGADIPWSDAKAFGDGRDPVGVDDWFEASVDGPHKAEAAWNRGFTGEGVNISVIDDGVDFAHPDLMGTHKIYEGNDYWDPYSPSPYNGWPYIMDPFTMRAYFYETYFGSAAPAYISQSFGGTTYMDTSYTPSLTQCGPAMLCFHYTPWIDYGTRGYQHTYVINPTMTKSGVVHVGTHTDESLRDYVWGEKVAVLVTDPNVAGVYDTVYVDLDDDYDFRDEKPVTKADLANLAATYNNPVAYRDMTDDGKADLSGGLLYFIADGELYPPAFEWLYAPNLMGMEPPGNGDLIAMHGPWDSGYSHGTNCASNAVSNGVADGMLPAFQNLDGTGKPSGAVKGMAPDAGLVAMNNGWYYSGYLNARDAYMLAALGYDGVDQYGWHWWYGEDFEDSDTIVATSNSYGFSEEFNDGFDYTGQFVVQVQRWFGQYLQFLFSTGNGAPGYGTVAPPSPALGIAVGASTEYGSTGWDTITNTDQIMFNDVAAFSNAGPGARGGAGVDVLAGGAYAAGSEELNYYSPGMYGILDGNVSWDDWGGTSRSAPTALGVYALMAQAYKANHEQWPTHEVGKALFMSSATDINYDVFKQGAGSVNADIATLVASGEYGVYMGADSASWDPGDFRGVDYPGFAHVVYPGDTWSKEFTIVNDSQEYVYVDVQDSYLQLIHTAELSLTVTPAMKAAETADNFYKAFDYFIPITATLGHNDAWYNVPIPEGTDLMVVRQIFPFNEFDRNGDNVWDARYYLMVYNWKDQDDDGLVWDDKNSNGVVNFRNGPSLGTSGLKASPELLWDHPDTELDRWEYGRFGYNRPVSNNNELTIRDPLERMHDGLFIGLRHLYTSRTANIATHLQYRIEFYQKADVPWLSVGENNGRVPAGEWGSFVGRVDVPEDMPAGVYEAAFEVLVRPADGGELPVKNSVEYPEYTIVVPVVMNVAANLEALLEGGTLGGYQAYDYDADQMYNNGAVRGYFMWDWRAESGDGRFYYMDLDNTPAFQPLMEIESFEGEVFPPDGWHEFQTGDAVYGWQLGIGLGSSGEQCAWHDDENTAVGSKSWLVMPRIEVPDEGLTELRFWHATGWATYMEKQAIRVTTAADPNPVGATYTEIWSAVNPVSYWTEAKVDLSAYAGQEISIAFYYEGDWASEWYIDDVGLYGVGYPYDPTAHVLVRDVWDDVAPHTDIDTIVFGPSTNALGNSTFGVWSGSFVDSSFFGPYPLNIVGRSADDRAGSSIWRFNTTSGGAEEWVSFPLEDGLHEVFEHNILFEGDKFDVVFTKTLGLLTEDVHIIEVETYADQGVAGEINLESTMDLNGLVVEAYLGDLTHYSWANQPIAFVNSNTIEWTNVFQVSDGVSIEAWTSSSTIADLDLYLFFWTGTTWSQRAYSAGADSNEHIFVANPADGFWLVGINNWSGPAGTFNLDVMVASKVPGITVTGVPEGPISANTPIKLTVHFDYPMQPGMTYPGSVIIGVPEAPALKVVPVNITKLAASGAVVKTVDLEITYPNQFLRYTVDLYNFDGADQIWEFVDALPSTVDLVDFSMTKRCWVNPGTPYDTVVLAETFDTVTAPALPPGWGVTIVVDPGTDPAWQTRNGTRYPSGYASHSLPNLAFFNSFSVSSTGSGRLHRTTGLDLTGSGGALVTFWMFHDTGYSSSQDRVQVQVSVDGGVNWVNAGDPVARYGTLGWAEHSVEVDLSPFADLSNVRFAFLGISGYGNDCHIDDVTIAVAPAYCMPDPIYDPIEHELTYEGPLPASGIGAAGEGFEAGKMPPAGWALVQNNPNETWQVDTFSPHSGTYYATCLYDEALLLQNEWMLSPVLEGLTGGEAVSLWSMGSVYWGVTPNDNYDLNVWLVVGAPGGADDVLLGKADDDWVTNWIYAESSYNLPATLPAGDLRIGIQYYGMDGAQAGVDDIALPGVLSYQPSATIDMLVYVHGGLAAGTQIVNRATLETTHLMPAPLGAQVETLHAQAVSVIGDGPNLVTSYKTAPDMAQAGDILRYQVHIVNTGSAAAWVTLIDPIPDGATLYDWDSPPPFTFWPNPDGSMGWSGLVGPGDHMVFTFWVRLDDDMALWEELVENVATISWAAGPDGLWPAGSMELSAVTRVVAPYWLYLPAVHK